MNAPSEDFKTLLIAESSLGLTYETDLFISHVPADRKGLVVGLFDRAGLGARTRLDETGGDEIEEPTVQVQIHGDKGEYLAAAALARNIKAVLQAVSNQVIGGAFYQFILASGSPSSEGYDRVHRPIVVTNYRVMRTAT
jgi:hypothetical protein